MIAQNNNVPRKLQIRLKQQNQHKIAQPLSITYTIIIKWATFRYSTPRIRKITNLFKHTNVKIAFRSNNTISQLTKSDTKCSTPTHDRRGIYKLTCNTCKLAYIGQTSRYLKLRYRGHIRYIRNNPQSAYAQYILHSQHEYGTMDDMPNQAPQQHNCVSSL